MLSIKVLRAVVVASRHCSERTQLSDLHVEQNTMSDKENSGVSFNTDMHSFKTVILGECVRYFALHGRFTPDVLKLAWSSSSSSDTVQGSV